MPAIKRRRYRVSLLQLQALCEENYARLVRLQRVGDGSDSFGALLPRLGRVRLHFYRQGPYTSDVQLTFSANHPLLNKLNRLQLVARLYHDMRVAEVLAIAGRRKPLARQTYPNGAMQQADEKQQWNRWLNDWLRHLVRCGEPQILTWRQRVTGVTE